MQRVVWHPSSSASNSDTASFFYYEYTSSFFAFEQLQQHSKYVIKRVIGNVIVDRHRRTFVRIDDGTSAWIAWRASRLSSSVVSICLYGVRNGLT